MKILNSLINKFGLGDFLAKKMTEAHQAGLNFIVNSVNSYEKNNLRVLDLGCGEGQIVKILLGNYSKKLELFGIDIVSSDKIALNNLKYTEMNLENQVLPYEDEFFDIIYSNQVIEHIIHKDVLISESCRILKKGGLFLLATENIASLDTIISLFFGQEPSVQHTSLKNYTSTFLSPHFMKPIPIVGYQIKNELGFPIHTLHKNVCSYFGLKRLLEVNGFSKIKIHSFGSFMKLFEKLFPIYNRVIVAVAKK